MTDPLQFFDRGICDIRHGGPCSGVVERVDVVKLRDADARGVRTVR
jgi:hypothetical protein